MTENRFKRIIRHLMTTKHQMFTCFSKQELERIEYIISHSEKKHQGEIVCVIETRWDLKSLIKQKSTKERALEWFGSQKIWDTKQNIGVLVYISFADKQIEIIVDRGISQVISNSVWDLICQKIIASFQQNQFLAGLDLGLKLIEQELMAYFPRQDEPYYNQIPNKVIIY